jgi:SAM-dependent methyltransferase
VRAAARSAGTDGALGAVARALAARDLRPLLRAVPPGGLVVDVGAGAGLRAAVLAGRGLRVLAVEPDAAEAARAEGALAGRHGAVVARVPLEGVGAAEVGEGGAHGALLWHVAEHLDDPWEGLRAVRGLLRPGGLLLAAVPNPCGGEARLLRGRWGGWEPARHRWHLDAAALGRMAVGAGFDAVRVRAHGGWLPALGLAASLVPRADPQRATSPAAGVVLAAALTPAAGVLAALGGAPQLVLTARAR